MAANAQASQDFLPIKEIKSGVVSLKDGGLRGVLMASSINFALKNVDEQAAIIMQFQSLLNALDFSVEVYIQSRHLDIRPYVSLLEEARERQVSSILQLQTKEYMQFIEQFTSTVNVMTKNFFVVVPYDGVILKKATSGLPFGGKNDSSEVKGERLFEENLTQLEQRMELVEGGLARCGIRSVRLGTEEITELYYRLYNPSDPGNVVQSS